MKKIASFITALILFVLVIVIFHFSMQGDLKFNNKAFGTWVNQYKNMSCQAVDENLGENTMLVFGSSEFNHGKDTPYHPANLFKNTNVDLMLIGSAYNQCLSHAIKLGAVEQSVSNRKAVLILSPTWFYQGGVSPDNYSLRFSESDYMALMENPDISKETKEYIAKRSERLLGNDKTMKSRVERYDRMFVDGDQSLLDKVIYRCRKVFVEDKEIMTVKAAMETTGLEKVDESKITDTPIDWDKVENQAVSDSRKDKNNQYAMSDSVFNKKFKGRIKKSEGSHSKDSLGKSPEYSDLECFLDICKESNIDVMIVVQPLNGYWYDLTGLTEDKRQEFRKNIYQIAGQYGAEVADFTGLEYSKTYFKDAVHPDGEGWVKINEKIYDFYNED